MPGCRRPGRPRRRRPAAAAQRHPARASSSIYHGDWSYAGLRRVHQPRARTSSSRPTTSMPSSPASARSSRPATAATTMPRARLITKGNLRPVREVRSAYARLRANERAGRARRGDRVRRRCSREGGRPRSPPDDRRHRRSAHRAASSRRSTTRDRRPGRHLRRRRRRARGPAPDRARIGLPRLPGGAREARRARLRRADRRRHAAVQDTPNVLRR